MIQRIIEFFQPPQPGPTKREIEMDAAARAFTEKYMKKYKEAHFGHKS